VTRTELEELIDRVRRPHNRRMVALLALFLIVFIVGLLSMPRGVTRTQAERWVMATLGLEVIVGAVGMVFAFRPIKGDCYRLGVLCQSCGKHLYTRRRLLFGGEECAAPGSVHIVRFSSWTTS
jgi:hypothetical protein